MARILSNSTLKDCDLRSLALRRPTLDGSHPSNRRTRQSDPSVRSSVKGMKMLTLSPGVIQLSTCPPNGGLKVSP